MVVEAMCLRMQWGGGRSVWRAARIVAFRDAGLRIELPRQGQRWVRRATMNVDLGLTAKSTARCRHLLRGLRPCSRSRATSFYTDRRQILESAHPFDVGPGILERRLHPRRTRLLPGSRAPGVAEAGLFPMSFYI